MTIITVSRQLGTGAELVIAALSRDLKLSVIDRAVIGKAAISAGVPRVVFQELTYEGQRGLVQRMLEVMQALPGNPVSAQADPDEAIGPLTLPFGGAFSTPPPPSGSRATLQRYVEVIGMVIRDLAGTGDVLIVGLGGQAILRDDPRAFHVKIIASFEDRVERLMERDHIHRGEAMRRLQTSDEARASYVRKYYGIDWLDPLNYHLVINMSRYDVPGAVASIAAIVSGNQPISEGCVSRVDQADDPTADGVPGSKETPMDATKSGEELVDAEDSISNGAQYGR